MAGYFVSIEQATLENNDFRRVLFTGKHQQLVLMCLQGGEDIGDEVHDTVDQFFRIEEGEARFVLAGEEVHVARDGYVVVVPAGTRRNVINTSATQPVRLYTLYAPPNHPDGTVHRTRAEAMEAEHHH